MPISQSDLGNSSVKAFLSDDSRLCQVDSHSQLGQMYRNFQASIIHNSREWAHVPIYDAWKAKPISHRRGMLVCATRWTNFENTTLNQRCQMEWKCLE